MSAGPISNQNELVSIDRKVDFLRRAESYGEARSAVAAIETHKSWVFLTERFAFKLKKPILYDSTDFRPLETRRINCLEEVRLNRRLAASVYLGVVPLTLESTGTLELDGRGEPVDWLVKMRRLPFDLMLDRQIQNGTLEEQEVRRLAAKLTCFYQTVAPVELDAAAYRGMLLGEIAINRRDLIGLASIAGFERARVAIAAQVQFLDRCHEVFDRRVEEGRIVEGHGDLRPEHVCLEPDPVIFDCLEFNIRLRTLDIVDELAFLSLQCERLGAASIGQILFDTYVQATGDDPSEMLIRFYKSYRATTWARLAIWRARELSDVRRLRWVDRAREYLDLALSHAEPLS